MNVAVGGLNNKVGCISKDLLSSQILVWNTCILK